MSLHVFDSSAAARSSSRAVYVSPHSKRFQFLAKPEEDTVLFRFYLRTQSILHIQNLLCPVLVIVSTNNSEE